MSIKLGIQHQALAYYQVCLNDGTRLTFDLFKQRSTSVLYAFVRPKWWSTQKLLRSMI